ncbi:MFS transporter [Bordetella genomosp. 5]|uniref:tripartite tricarboxylate transporter substrate binding protein n=1 Tax=Bordetella genomosp. 5 TaxID=1395608 RepID=UPI000B9E5A6E|nr:tripartite tricarboxylate transporter substrate binding protein [Bordetella genomosp. 5]OZI42130.1 MFS transporter [Bordetella genomosp. 5]
MIDITRRRVVAGLGAACAGAMGLVPDLARARDAWPARPVNFIVPFPPGGPVDTTARLATQPMAQRWSEPAVVDNKSGAGGIVGAQFAAKAAPDGYNFFFASIHHAVLPSLRGNLSYDITTDFEPVGMAALFPIVLVVHAGLPVNSVQELIAYARANPGKLSYGSSGTGGGTHLAGELFCSMTGVKMQHVPYRGSAPAMQDLLGGQVQVMFADGPSAMPHLQGGKLRPLGVGNPEPSPLFPGVQTIAASGVPDYEAYSWSGLLAPKGTPRATIERLNADLVRVLSDPATTRAMMAAGAQPRSGTPAEFGEFLRAEIDKWGKVIKTAGIKLDAGA